MPAKKLCSHVDRNGSCINFAPCEEHAPKPWESSNRRAELPSDWGRRVRTVLRRNELHNDGLCQDGRVCGGLSLAREVHHPASPSNHDVDQLEAVCAACHRASTNRQAADARRR
jgi:hypothetical protein